jgi:hypothetical protein
MSSGGRLAILFAVLIGSVLLLAGCFGGGGDKNTTSTASGGGASGPVTPGVYVGQVQGTDNSIALVTDAHRLSGAYLCIPQSTSQWIRPAPFANGKAPLVARRGVTLGSATFNGNTASGEVTAGGQRSFNAQIAKGDSGLYRKISGTANQPGFSETGWIVLQDGSVCGSTNSITSGGGFQSQQAAAQPASGSKVTNFTDPFPF